MKVAHSATFEFEERQPVTHRGTVEGTSASTCVSRATRLAQRALKPINWSSFVVVLLERLPEDGTAIVAPVSDQANP